jgi:hypothetical protein
MDPLLAFDKLMGHGVERLVRFHHARRLRRIRLLGPLQGLLVDG